eukprot:scaffold122955_cov41-Tisochrysis_lutea.AAC.1
MGHTDTHGSAVLLCFQKSPKTARFHRVSIAVSVKKEEGRVTSKEDHAPCGCSLTLITMMALYIIPIPILLYPV